MSARISLKKLENYLESDAKLWEDTGLNERDVFAAFFEYVRSGRDYVRALEGVYEAFVKLSPAEVLDNPDVEAAANRTTAAHARYTKARKAFVK